MSRRFLLLFALTFWAVSSHVGADEPRRKVLRAKPACSQMIVTIADGWNFSTGKLQCYDRTRSGWKPAFAKPIDVLLGRNGMAWGRGVRGQSEEGKRKREGDGRAPAGVFKIGKIYTDDAKLPKGVKYPYRTITKWDAWVDDPNLAEYNRHVVVDPNNVPSWFEKQKMRHGDFAYRWLIELRHNADPPKPGAGSAIFFHTRRGPTCKTAGCTTMSVADLTRVMRWLKAAKNPQYTLLPKSEYLKKRKAWNLPELK